jgi:hypothetical protein
VKAIFDTIQPGCGTPQPGFSSFRLFVKIANPTMGFQFLNLLSERSASVSRLAGEQEIPGGLRL